MRALLLVPLIAASSLARAGVATYTPLIDTRAVDPACRPLAEIPQNTRLAGPRFDAAISVASCMASARTRHIVLAPSLDSVAALDGAEAPALAILDRVIRIGDPAHVLLARHAKLDILEGNVARLLAAVPPVSPVMSRADVAAHFRLVDATAALARPWQRRADATRRAIARLVNAHPELATRDPVLAHAITNSRLDRVVGRPGR